MFSTRQTPASWAEGFGGGVEVAGGIGIILVCNSTSTGDGVVVQFFTYGTSGKECWGSYNFTSQTGKGPGYVNSCIHSGAIATSGDLPTTWYNYALASAGTIMNANSEDTAGNTAPATESVCPKGWALPSPTQTRSIGPNSGSTTYVSNFSPVLGGRYLNGTLDYETTDGYWWGSEMYNSSRRYYLRYSGSNLYTHYYNDRYAGFYIRCVQAP